MANCFERYGLRAFPILVVLVCLPLGSVLAQDASVWDGVYTEAQAERGKDAYAANCAACHGQDPAVPTGATAGPPLAGSNFMLFWKDHSVGELFEIASTQMPQGRPGSLPKETIADIFAFLFMEDGFPSGSEVLPADPAVLSNIKIEAAPAN